MNTFCGSPYGGLHYDGVLVLRGTTICFECSELLSLLRYRAAFYGSEFRVQRHYCALPGGMYRVFTPISENDRERDFLGLGLQ